MAHIKEYIYHHHPPPRGEGGSLSTIFKPFSWKYPPLLAPFIKIHPIAKSASDVIPQTDSDKQNGMMEDLKLFQAHKQVFPRTIFKKASVPSTIFKPNVWPSFPSHFSQNTLILSDFRGVLTICILFSDVALFLIVM